MIRAPLSRLRDALRSFRRREAGSGALELVIVLPVMMMVFMYSAESGLYMTRQIMLERAVDLTVRDLRLGRIPTPTHAELKDDICANSSIIPDCDTALRVELVRVSTTNWNLPNTAIECVDRDEPIELSLEFNPGVENELMLVRVCLIQDAIFPGTKFSEGIAREGDSAGGYAIVSTSAFVNEPS